MQCIVTDCDSSLEGFDFADLKSHSVSAREGLCIFSSLNILVKGAFFPGLRDCVSSFSSFPSFEVLIPNGTLT